MKHPLDELIERLQKARDEGLAGGREDRLKALGDAIRRELFRGTFLEKEDAEK